MRTNEIHWHDSKIKRVIELPEQDMLLLDIDYPVDWESDKYEPHRVTFVDVYVYEIHEGPIVGAPTLRSAEEQPAENGTRKIRLDTTAGYRIIRCRQIAIQPLGEDGQ